MMIEIAAAAKPIDERDAPGVDRAREGVPPRAVGAEPMLGRRPLIAPEEIDGVRPDARDERREDGEQDEDCEHDHADHREPVPPETAKRLSCRRQDDGAFLPRARVLPDGAVTRALVSARLLSIISVPQWW